MADAVDIDGAFDTLVKQETASRENIVPHTETTGLAVGVLGVEGAQQAFEAVAAAREDFIANATVWNQYAVDENVMGALCVKITAFFDAVEGFLPYLPSIASQAYAMAEDEALAAALVAAGGKTLSDFLAALLLPASELVSFVDFLYAGSLYMSTDALVLASFNQVQDVVSAVQSAEHLLAIQGVVHWQGNPAARLVLVDAFRSLVREGDLGRVPDG